MRSTDATPYEQYVVAQLRSGASPGWSGATVATVDADGPVTFRELRRAIRDACGAHPWLRVRYTMEGDRLRRDVTAAETLTVGHVDLSSLRADEAAAGVQQLTRQALDAPVRPLGTQLFRATVVSLGPLRHLVIVVAHWLVLDEASLPLFCRALARSLADPGGIERADLDEPPPGAPVAALAGALWPPRADHGPGPGAAQVDIPGSPDDCAPSDCAPSDWAHKDWAHAAAVLAIALARVAAAAQVSVTRALDTRRDPAAIGPHTRTPAYLLRPAGSVADLAGTLRAADPYGTVIGAPLVATAVPAITVRAGELTLTLRPLAPTRVAEPVRLVSRDGGLLLRYDADVVPSADATRLAQLVAALAAEPRGTTLRAAAGQPEPEPAAEPEPEPEPEQTIGARFRALARCHPDAVAVVGDDGALTYAELADKAAGIARALRERGAGPEITIGICLPRTSDLVLATAGTVLAGAAYVPLDPTYPAARLRLVARDAGCLLVICAPGTEHLVPGELAVPLGQLAAEGNREPGAPGPPPEDPPRPAPDCAAYVIYTSGSTGEPKGVVVTHRNVLRLFDTTAELFAPDRRDAWTMFHSHAFDFSVWEMWGPLLSGGRVIVVPYLTSRSPAAFLDLLRRERVTVLSQTPSAFRLLLAQARERGYPELPLRLVIFGGEALNAALLRPWVDAYGDQRPRLVNMYGITETTVHATAAAITRADLAGTRSPIGRALADLSVDVLDGQLRPLPAGAPGELAVGGAGVTRGYLGRPAETARRYRPDPHGAPGGRLYLSGDLARREPGGELSYLARDDDQVKLRGFRMELGEVEAVLSTAPGVAYAAADVRPGPSGEPALAGYVVPSPGAGLDVAAVRAWCAELLPPQLVPSAYLAIAALPMTSNGKLDRAALPDPADPADPAATAADGAAGPAAQGPLAEVWREVLGVTDLNGDANFFRVGGDSILAVRLASQAQQRGLPLRLEDIFRVPRLAELAALLDGAPRAAPTEPARESAGPGAGHPLAAMQLGMVYHTELTGDPRVYHDLVGARVRAAWNPDALTRALDQLTRRHAILRTSFDLSGAEPRQLVHPAARVPLTIDDRSGGTEAEQQAAVTAARTAELSRRFDWTRPPLMRAHVVACGPGEFHLTIGVHHAILDGWSLARAMTDLLMLYAAAMGDPVQLPPPPRSSYPDFLAAERAALADQAAVAYWDGLLSRPPALPAAAWATGSGTGGIRSEKALDSELTAAAAAAAARQGLPLKSVMTAAHLHALARLRPGPEVVTGLVVGARPDSADAERMLGLFLNVLPVRLAVGDAAILDSARAAFAAEADLMPYRRFPLAEIQRRLGRPPFDTVFNYTHFHVYQELSALAGLRVLDWWYYDRTTFPLTVEVVVDRLPDRVTLMVTQAPDTVPHDVSGRFIAAFQDALGQLRR